MRDILSKLPKFNIYWILFLATVAVLVIKLPDVWFGANAPAGYDTTGHYEAFLKQAELISQGRLKGYFLDWFGGVPIFYFYSPLLFWLGGLLVVALPFLAPAVIFKLLLLSSLAALAPAFYYFSQTFLPIKPHPLVAFFLVILYLFFQPHVMGELGVGVSGAMAAGLINQAPGLVLSLVFLSFFKRLLDSQGKIFFDRYFYLSVIFGTLLFYTHILSTLFAAILAVLLFIIYFRRHLSFVKSSLVLIMIAGISAYYILPFLAYYQYSSGWDYRRGEGFFFDPLQPLLAIDWLGLFRGHWSGFNWPWLVVVVSAVTGLITLVKKGSVLIPILFIFPFLVIPRDYLPEVLGFSLHYYRIMPLLIILFLTASLYSFSLLIEKIGNKPLGRNYGFVLLVILGLLTGWRLSVYSFHPDKYNIKPEVLISAEDPYDYYPNLSSYPGSKSAMSLVKCILDQPSHGGRISIEHDLSLLMKEIGSTHFFDYALPQAGQAILQGLYSESSNQTAFIYPSFALISPQMGDYNYPESNRLLWNNVFRAQSPNEAIKQMGLFNVEYVVAYNNFSNYNLASLKEDVVLPVGCQDSWFSLYRISDSLRRSFISYPQFKPVLYIKNNNLSFRNISLGWYTMPDIYDLPVIYREGLKLNGFSNLSENEVENISALVIGSEGLDKEEIDSLVSFGKPVLILSEGEYQGDKLPVGFMLVNNFRPTAGFDEYNKPYYPDTYSLQTFQDFLVGVLVSEVADFNQNEDIKTLSWQDENISFYGQGPVLINAGFFPAWQSSQKDQKIYEVTPGQMLVFASGDTILEFKATIFDRYGVIISLSSIIILLFLIFKMKIKKDERNT